MDKMELMNDVHVLDLATRTWTRKVSKGVVPERRAGHTASLVISDVTKKPSMVIYGGRGAKNAVLGDIHFTSLDDFSWAKSPGTGQIPAARSLHCASTLPEGKDSSTSKIVLFGGELADPKQSSNDVYLLEV